MSLPKRVYKDDKTNKSSVSKYNVEETKSSSDESVRPEPSDIKTAAKTTKTKTTNKISLPKDPLILIPIKLKYFIKYLHLTWLNQPRRLRNCVWNTTSKRHTIIKRNLKVQHLKLVLVEIFLIPLLNKKKEWYTITILKIVMALVSVNQT